jgi:hypothetical protein
VPSFIPAVNPESFGFVATTRALHYSVKSPVFKSFFSSLPSAVNKVLPILTYFLYSIDHTLTVPSSEQVTNLSGSS